MKYERNECGAVWSRLVRRRSVGNVGRPTSKSSPRTTMKIADVHSVSCYYVASCVPRTMPCHIIRTGLDWIGLDSIKWIGRDGTGTG